MSRSTFKTLILASVTAVALAGVAHAGIVGESTDPSVLQVGVSTINAGPHTAGKSGVSVKSIGLSAFVDFQGLQAVSPSSGGVSTINSPSTAPGSHNGMGVFNFAKVSTGDIWFGEWSDTANANDGTHTVYYVGDDTGATAGTGTASYTVKGLSDYATNGILEGTFNADFTGSTLSGFVQSASTGYKVDIGSVGISGLNIASTAANATATQGATTLASGGEVSGKFFGANAAALAGVVTFGGNSVYDTAFGGTKN
ncbi:Slam-dependent surface lipoprotein [Caulobacter endophyticus]|uniref:Slam-dependent surface lipoprotein n=1 Tax=Caulobacter endophyticus TaxID=2172652 RepID=UPI00240F44FC|nr:Slam-dependent surface lipoprotein [Caulobacter endophyticus]MDG2527836.1 hypothetical protein [Caulobacter endophyticus]